jgi:hypothetical protein
MTYIPTFHPTGHPAQPQLGMFKFFPEEFVVTLFLAVEEKVTGLKGFKSKSIKDDGVQRALFFQQSVIWDCGIKGGGAVNLVLLLSPQLNDLGQLN